MAGNRGNIGFDSFVALGDSFTEGLSDLRADGSLRGWADRFAERAAEVRPGLRYANLAVRGKVLRELADEQLPRAIGMRPDLVSVAVGGNDLLRPRADPDALASIFDDVVRRLRQAGCQVIVFAGFDPGTFPVIRLIRGKAAAYNMHLRAIAARRECHLVDLWAMRCWPIPGSGAWTGCTQPTGIAGWRCGPARVMGVPVDGMDWREPLPGGAPHGWPAQVGGVARRPPDGCALGAEHAALGEPPARGVSSDGAPPSGSS